jgi:hypothetical protein
MSKTMSDTIIDGVFCSLFEGKSERRIVSVDPYSYRAVSYSKTVAGRGARQRC